MNTIQQYIQAEPLTKSEIKRGSAIRVVKAVVAAEARHIEWAVLCMHRHPAEAAEHLEVTGLAGMFVKDAQVFDLGKEAIYGNEDGLWHVREYGLVLPLSLVHFSLRCGEARYPMSFSRCKKLLFEHHAETRHAASDKAYEAWLENHRNARTERDGVELLLNPLMSIVTPVYKTAPTVLRATLESVLKQTYSHWEMIIVNASPENQNIKELLAELGDDRITVIEQEKNEGIAGNTNVGIEATHGDFVSFLDHDDVLEHDALQQIVKAINEHSGDVDLLYCDEDSIDAKGRFHTPLFKPQHNPDLLYANDYVLHWLTVSRRMLACTTRSTQEVEGAQDYDLTLKAFEKTKNIVHIPEVLYHWRSHEESINSNPESKPYSQLAGEKALEAHFARRSLSVQVSQEEIPCTYRSVFARAASAPSFSCVVSDSVLHTQTMAFLEGCVACLPGKEVSFEMVPYEKDSIRSCDEAIRSTRGDVVFVCSQDIQPFDESTLEILLGYFERPEIGAVSPRVMRKDGLVDYAGICMQPDGAMTYLSRYFPRIRRTYIDRLRHPYNSIIANPELHLIRRAEYEACGGFDGVFKSIEYASADVSMKLWKHGMLHVHTPFAEVTLASGRTLLGDYETDEEIADKKVFRERYAHDLAQGDPSHNPNFDPQSSYYRLNK